MSTENTKSPGNRIVDAIEDAQRVERNAKARKRRSAPQLGANAIRAASGVVTDTTTPSGTRPREATPAECEAGVSRAIAELKAVRRRVLMDLAMGNDCSAICNSLDVVERELRLVRNAASKRAGRS